MKRHHKALVLIGVLSLFAGAFLAALSYSFRSAEKKAVVFCAETPIGSDIGKAVERAKTRKIPFGDGDEYTFFFPSVTGFDKAVCSLWVDKNHQVIAKSSQMEFD